MRQSTSELTARQVQILKELEKGKLYKEIAEELGISTGTMKQHVHKILKKLEANNRIEAVIIWRNNERV
ncbi:MAG: response regulator transcription factor [Saprospiraceae bacterium]|jgi:DNA-binding NarL/FixJ family response regulator|nr:response regulator transcription factor [Saprospiraceae bacterium]